MKMDRIREAEMAQRKGSTTKTVLQTIWLLACFAGAYLAVNWMVANRVFSYQDFYGAGMPGWFPRWAIQGVLMLILVAGMQIFVFLGFAMANPRGRYRSGTPTAHSVNKDPVDF